MNKSCPLSFNPDLRANDIHLVWIFGSLLNLTCFRASSLFCLNSSEKVSILERSLPESEESEGAIDCLPDDDALSELRIKIELWGLRKGLGSQSVHSRGDGRLISHVCSSCFMVGK